jgi:CRISPR/Cas system CSM-associated protein Csm3 (group 7 of RAMP superfamily)
VDIVAAKASFAEAETAKACVAAAKAKAKAFAKAKAKAKSVNARTAKLPIKTFEAIAAKGQKTTCANYKADTDAFAGAKTAYENACSIHAEARFAFDDACVTAKVVNETAHAAYLDSIIKAKSLVAINTAKAARVKARIAYATARASARASYKIARCAFDEARAIYAQARAANQSTQSLP